MQQRHADLKGLFDRRIAALDKQTLQRAIEAFDAVITRGSPWLTLSGVAGRCRRNPWGTISLRVVLMAKWRTVSLIRSISERLRVGERDFFSCVYFFCLGVQTHFVHVFFAGILPALFGLNLKRTKILQ